MTEATNLPEPIKENNDGLDLTSLTDSNWLYVKHYLETGDIKKAYDLAGYEGTARSAPYELFRKLKPFIEEIGNMTATSRLKLVADLNHVLSIPLLDKYKLGLTFSEWIRARKLAISITPDTQPAPKMSVLVVNRYMDKAEEGKGNTHPIDIDPSNIIDVG
jgi:hypothetical protein